MISEKAINAIDSLLVTIEKGGHGSGPRLGHPHPHVGAGQAKHIMAHMAHGASSHAHRATLRVGETDKKDAVPIDGNDAVFLQSMEALGHSANHNHINAANSHTAAMLTHQQAANECKPGSGACVGHMAAADAHEHAATQHHFVNYVTEGD